MACHHTRPTVHNAISLGKRVIKRGFEERLPSRLRGISKEPYVRRSDPPIGLAAPLRTFSLKHKSRKEKKMQRQISQAALAGLIAVMLLSLATVASAYNDATALTGTVVNVNHDLNYITVRDDVTGKNFKIDTRNMNTRQSIDVWNLRAGDRVSATGAWSKSDTFRADRVMLPAARALNRIANGVTGVVETVNRDLNYFTMRDSATGRSVKVDVRRMDARRSVNVWQLRNGDLVTVNGKWAKNDRSRFRADFVNFANQAPMASGMSSPNVITGVVESVNRDLNYVTLRNDATGLPVKIDVRDMDTRRSVNVWRLRTGDRITINGTWADRDRFKAEMVAF